jgi:hypothetical protein
MISSESYIIFAVLVALALVALIYLLSPMSLPAEPLLYLIGGRHAVQFKSAMGESEGVQKKREAFTAHVAEMIDKLDIEILAEEFNEEAKKESDVREMAAVLGKTALDEALEGFSWDTVLEQFSKAKGIEHRFCDPNTKEREALGVEDPDSKHGRAQREQEWLSRIADCKCKRVLFVCGDKHYDDFAQLLAANGFNVQHGPHYDVSSEEFLDLEGTTPDV